MTDALAREKRSVRGLTIRDLMVVVVVVAVLGAALRLPELLGPLFAVAVLVAPFLMVSKPRRGDVLVLWFAVYPIFPTLLVAGASLAELASVPHRVGPTSMGGWAWMISLAETLGYAFRCAAVLIPVALPAAFMQWFVAVLSLARVADMPQGIAWAVSVLTPLVWGVCYLFAVYDPFRTFV